MGAQTSRLRRAPGANAEPFASLRSGSGWEPSFGDAEGSRSKARLESALMVRSGYADCLRALLRIWRRRLPTIRSSPACIVMVSMRKRLG